MVTALLCPLEPVCVTCVDCLSPDVSHVFPEFPAPDLGSTLLQESVTLHDVKALQLVYRRHCEVTPYSARPNPHPQLPRTTTRSVSHWRPEPMSSHRMDLLLGTASVCPLLTSKAPLGTSEDPTAAWSTRHMTRPTP